MWACNVRLVVKVLRQMASLDLIGFTILMGHQLDHLVLIEHAMRLLVGVACLKLANDVAFVDGR